MTLLAVAGFVVASAFVTAAGRIGYGPNTVLAPRYVAGSSTFWAAMIFPAAVLAASPGGRFGSIARKTFFPVVLGLLAVAQYAQFDRIERARSRLRPAESAMLTGVTDFKAFARISENPQSVETLASILARDRSGVFRRREYEWLGRRLDEVFGTERAGPCVGDFERIRRRKKGALVSGWAAIEQTGAPIDTIVVANEKSVITGLAYGGYPRPGRSGPHADRSRDDNGWRGHTRPFRGRGWAYGVVGAQDLCAIPNHKRYPRHTVTGVIGTINGQRSPQIAGNQPITVRGWAADWEAGAPVARVELLIDGKKIGETSVFFRRPAVATNHGRQDFETCGWEIEGSLGGFPPGRYLLQARAVSPTGAVGPLRPKVFFINQ